MKKLKKYELKINPAGDSLVNAIALVEEPAIESNFIAFTKEYKLEEFVKNDDKMELIGVAMIPNQLIYRLDKKTQEEYEVYFSTQTIRQIAQEYFKSGFQHNMNIGHTATPAKSYIFQSYITDKQKGIAAPKGIECSDGSWIIGVKVEDKNVWNDIKEGKVKGFSIEGIFEFIQSNYTKQDDELMGIYNQINKIINAIKN